MKRRNGFTLIELLTVITLLGVISLIAVPVSFGIVEKVKKDVFLADVRSGIHAAELYVSESKDDIKKLNVKDKRLDITNNNFGEGEFLIDENGVSSALTVTDQKNRWCVSGYITDMKIDKDCNNLDTTPPENVLLGISNVSVKSISVLLNAQDLESLIIGYEYRIKKSDASVWEDWVKSVPEKNEYTFLNLLSNTFYDLQGRARNGNRMMTESNIITVKTNNLVAPILTPNTANWINQDVIISIAFSPLDDSVNSYSVDGGETFITTLNMTETVNVAKNGLVVARTAVDSEFKTGNLNISNIDKIIPTCVSAGSNTAWTNGNRLLTGTCADTGGSGCVGNVSLTYSSNLNSTVVGPGIVKDRAGNQVTCPLNQVVRIDKTAPTCASSGGNTAWTNGNRILTGACTDTGGSGCVSNVSLTYSGNLNSTASGPGIVKDNAGNQVTCPLNQAVRIDKIAPTCASSGGNTTWTNGNRILTGACTDTGGSGCVSNVSLTYSGNLNSTASGPGIVKDNAGNQVTCPANQVVRIDKIAPTCISSGGSSYWLSSLTISGSCSDTGGSGCIGNVQTTYDSPLEGYYSPGTVYDNAGNRLLCPTQQVRISEPYTGDACFDDTDCKSNQWCNGVGSCQDKNN